MPDSTNEKPSAVLRGRAIGHERPSQRTIQVLVSSGKRCIDDGHLFYTACLKKAPDVRDQSSRLQVPPSWRVSWSWERVSLQGRSRARSQSQEGSRRLLAADLSSWLNFWAVSWLSFI